MELFHMRERAAQELLAVSQEGGAVRCGELFAAAEGLARAGCGRRLVFLLCRNTPGTLLGYLGCLLCGAAALLLDAQTAPELLERLAGTYRPAFFLVPGDLPPAVRAVLPQRAALELRDCALLPTGEAGPELHPDLALLLTTSGSTGSPKLVRLSGKNLQSNAGSIARYLELTREERPITTLPMSYSYGMSIVNSHVLAGRRCCSPGGGFWSGSSGTWPPERGPPPWRGCRTPTRCSGGWV